MHAASSKQYDQEQNSRLDVEGHGYSYCDATRTITAAYESSRMIMSIGTMTVSSNIFNSLKGPQATGTQDEKTAGPNLDQLSIKRLCCPALRFGWQNSQLLHQPESIPISPALDEFSISDTCDGHSCY